MSHFNKEVWHDIFRLYFFTNFCFRFDWNFYYEQSQALGIRVSFKGLVIHGVTLNQKLRCCVFSIFSTFVVFFSSKVYILRNLWQKQSFFVFFVTKFVSRFLKMKDLTDFYGILISEAIQFLTAQISKENVWLFFDPLSTFLWKNCESHF